MTSTDRVISRFLRAVLLQMKALGLNQTTLARCAEEAPLRRGAGRRPPRRGPQGAARLNVSRPYVTKVLHGDVNITFGAALRLAKALEMDFVPQLVEPGKTGAEHLSATEGA